jgi:hypothetical protein
MEEVVPTTFDERSWIMKRILLMLAVALGLLLGGLLPSGTAEARPGGYRGYVYRPAVSVYAGPRYGYRG